MNSMKQIKNLLIILSVLMLAGSCKKDDVNAGKPNNETTIVKLPQATNDINLVAIDAKPGVIEVAVFEIRRDVKTEADLQKTMVVKIAPDPTLIADYNSNNGTNFVT